MTSWRRWSRVGERDGALNRRWLLIGFAPARGFTVTNDAAETARKVFLLP